jgi:hypothetical protein
MSSDTDTVEELDFIPEQQFMLTTLDNPYNPFLDYDRWNSYDVSMNYNTSAYLARIAKTSDELSLVENRRAINRAIDEIVELNLLGIYLKVTEDSWKDRSQDVSFPTVETKST